MTRTTIDFGIDLGTTNSAIAVLRGVSAEIIKNNLDTDITPSAVSCEKGGKLRTGDRAKSRIIDKPEDTYVEFKRQMGTDHRYHFKESGLDKSPEELSSEVLKSLRGDVARATGEEIISAVITVPAAFEQHQCHATKKAADLAGLKECPLLQEPVAAALAYGFQIDSEKAYWLVYDFGGGTFDAALIKAEEGLINVVHHGGDNFLGGSNMDWAILEKVILPKIASSYDLPDFVRGNARWRQAVALLKRSIEIAKIELTTADTVSLQGCRFEDNSGKEVDCEEISLSRKELILVAEPIIRRSIEISQKVLKEKNLSASGVQKIILVGGPTKAPYFRQMLKDGLGISIDHSVDPLTVVARGAAIFAGTQKIDQKLLRPAQVGEFKIDLPNKTIGHETEPLIGGKVTSVDGHSVAGFTLELANKRTQWRSGKITLRADGAFVANLFAEKGERNVFDLELHDSSGVRQKTVPDHLIYTVGAVIEEQPLINSIGVALVDNTTEEFFKKGSGLPLKGKATLRIAKPVTAGKNEPAVIIPLVEGENPAADRNRRIGEFVIPGEAIKRDLPSGTEVELTLRMDEKRQIKVNVYIQSLDIEFDYDLNSDTKKSTDVGVITREFAEESKRLRTLLTQAGEADDKQSVSELERLQASELVAEIKQSLTSAKTDPGAAEQCEKRLLEFKLALDAVETRIKWPTLVTEARNKLDDLDKLVKKEGSEKQQEAAEDLREKVEDIIRDKKTESLAFRVKEIDNLYYKVLFSIPDFWVFQFRELEKEKAKFTDPTKGERLLEMGHNYTSQNNVDGLRNVVRQLWELVPRTVLDEVQKRGLGGNLAR
jgi:molecular chaperone DnaK